MKRQQPDQEAAHFAASPPGNGGRGLKLGLRQHALPQRHASPPGNGGRGLKQIIGVVTTFCAVASPPGKGGRGLKQSGAE